MQRAETPTIEQIGQFLTGSEEEREWCAIAEEYVCSSAPAHLSGSDASGFLDLMKWQRRYNSERWRGVLASRVGEEALAERIRESTKNRKATGKFGFHCPSRAVFRTRLGSA